MKRTIGKIGVALCLLLALLVGMTPHTAYAQNSNEKNPRGYVSMRDAQWMNPSKGGVHYEYRGNLGIEILSEKDDALMNKVRNGASSLKVKITVAGPNLPSTDFTEETYWNQKPVLSHTYYLYKDPLGVTDFAVGHQVNRTYLMLGVTEAEMADGTKITMDVQDPSTHESLLKLEFIYNSGPDGPKVELDPNQPDPNLEAKQDALDELEKYLTLYHNEYEEDLKKLKNADNEAAIEEFLEKIRELDTILETRKNNPTSLTDREWGKIWTYLGTQSQQWNYAYGQLARLANKIKITYKIQADLTKDSDKLIPEGNHAFPAMQRQNGKIKIVTNVPIPNLTTDVNETSILRHNVITADAYEHHDLYQPEPDFDKHPLDDALQGAIEVTGSEKEYTVSYPELSPDTSLLLPFISVEVAPGARVQCKSEDKYVFVIDQKKVDALSELKKYLEAVKYMLPDDPNQPDPLLKALNTPENASAIQAFQAKLQEGKALQERYAQDPDTLTDADLQTIKGLLGYDDAQNKWNVEDGEFGTLAKQIKVKLEIDGSNEVLTTGGTAKVKSAITDLSKDSNATKRIHLIAVPKDGSHTYDFADDTMNANNGVYTFTIPSVEETIDKLRAVMEVDIAPGVTASAHVDFTVKKPDPAPPTPGPNPGGDPGSDPGSNPGGGGTPGGGTTPGGGSTPGGGVLPPIPSLPLPGPGTYGTTGKLIEERGEEYGYAVVSGGSVSAGTRLRVTDKANGKKDVILVDANGNQVYSDALMLVTIPAPKGQQSSYRVKVDGVYTTFELSADGRYVTMPLVFSRDGRVREDAVLRDGGVSVKGSREALANAYKLSAIDRGNARYSVNLLDQNDNKVHSNGPVMVTIPAPAGVGDVYRVKADGKWITFEVENRTVRFALVF